MSKYYPLMMKIDDMPCLVIGGGKVAERKIRTLLNFGAAITVIAPNLSEYLILLKSDGRISCLDRKFHEGDTFGFQLVFNTAPKIAANVKKDCIESGAILNSADQPELSDFIVPSSINKENFSLSVSTYGNAPFITKHTKQQLDDFLPKNIENIVNLANEFRTLIINDRSVLSEDKKRELYDEFIKIDWESIIDEEGIEKAKVKMYDILNRKNKQI